MGRPISRPLARATPGCLLAVEIRCEASPQFVATANTKLGVNRMSVLFNRAFRDGELSCDGFIRVTATNKVGYLTLAIRK
jgi:hypothetical protein